MTNLGLASSADSRFAVSAREPSGILSGFNYMKKLILVIIAAIASTVIYTSCHSNHYYDDLPQPIAVFLSDYWADPDIESYTQPSPQKYMVIIKNGPTLIFNEEFSWTDIDGNGLPLPEILLYDQLPPVLYDYIESGSLLNQVFTISRDARDYYVKLLDSDLTYDIQTQTVRQV